ncbi:MAG: DUF4124 domain-containing protein [Nitrosomonas sp.]|nr:DUF4124 domain-containing protein [Nitrosomonas sp.]
MKLFVLTGFLMATLLSIPQALAQVYKWVDENGKTQYTDRPPPPGVATEKKRFNTKGGTPSSSGASGTNQPQSLSEAREALDKRQVERKEEQSKQQSKAEEDKKKCIEAQTRLRMYTESPRLTVPDGAGGIAYVDDNERQKKIDQATKEIATLCKK